MNSTFIIYIFTQLLAIIFLYLAFKNKKNDVLIPIIKKNISLSIIYLIISASVLAFLAIFRSPSVGADYKTYIHLYDAIRTNTLTAQELEWLSPGYRILNTIFAFFFGNNYWIFFSFITFLTLFFLYKAIWNESKNPMLSLFMFLSFCLYYQFFNQFRQMLAIAIVLYSYKYLKNKNIIKYIFFILLATSFHKSALIMIPIYWISMIKINKKIIIGYLFICVLAYFSIDVMRVILKDTYYGQMYFGSQYDIVGKSSTYLNLIFRVGLLVSTLLFFKKIENPKTNILYHMAFLCTIVQILTVRSYVFGRVTTYFFVFYILLIPYIIETIFYDNIKKIVIILVSLVLSLYHFVYFNSNNAVESGYREYKFLFQEEM